MQLNSLPLTKRLKLILSVITSQTYSPESNSCRGLMVSLWVLPSLEMWMLSWFSSWSPLSHRTFALSLLTTAHSVTLSFSWAVIFLLSFLFINLAGGSAAKKKKNRSFKRFEIKLQLHLCSVYKRTLNFNDGYQLVISGITNVFSRVRWLESRDNELPDNVTAEDFDPRIWFQYISVP